VRKDWLSAQAVAALRLAKDGRVRWQFPARGL